MKEKLPLFLDIGTESVKAGFLKNRVLRYYDRFGVFTGEDFEKEVIEKAVLKSAEQVQSRAGLRAKHIIASLPADILKAKISRHFLERSSLGKIISRQEEEKIRQEFLKDSRKKISEVFFQECGVNSRELDFLEAVFLESSIDGYSVPCFAGYKGKKLETVVFSVFSPREYLEKFQSILKGLELPLLKIVYSGQYLPKLFGQEKEGILLDVGGQITQVFVLKNGRLSEISDFSSGGKDFSKVISQTFGLSEEKARFLKEAYAKGEITQETRSKIKQVLLGVADSWFLSLKSRLQEFNGFVPSETFLFGGSGQLPEIREVLQKLTEEKSPQVLKNPQLINLSLLSHAS